MSASAITRSRRRLCKKASEQLCRGSESLPDLSMARDVHLTSINGRGDAADDVQAIPHPNDFIPQDFNFLFVPRPSKGVSLDGIIKFLTGFILLSIVAFVSAGLFVSLKEKNEVTSYVKTSDLENNYGTPNFVLIKSDDNIDIVNVRLRQIHREFRKYLEETYKWRIAVEQQMQEIKAKNKDDSYKFVTSIDEKISEALALYNADKMGTIDYALETAGGSIVSTPDTTPFPARRGDILGILSVDYPSNPRVLIQPGTLPGQCFAFHGSIGRIRIELSHPVRITAFTMEHADFNLVADISSAPKDFQVYGVELEDDYFDFLGLFTYKIEEKQPLQTFEVDKLRSSKSYEHVELHILTNYGNSEYTCVYRFRVHGINLL